MVDLLTRGVSRLEALTGFRHHARLQDPTAGSLPGKVTAPETLPANRPLTQPDRRTSTLPFGTMPAVGPNLGLGTTVTVVGPNRDEIWAQINQFQSAPVFPGSYFAYRNTEFDKDVLTARYIHSQPSLSLLYAGNTASLLDAAEDAARQTGRVDQVMWLANAYDGEFNDLPRATYKAITLRETADSLLSSGAFSVSPFRYPGIDYGPFGGIGNLPPFADPYGPTGVNAPISPEQYARNSQNSDVFWRILTNKH